MNEDDYTQTGEYEAEYSTAFAEPTDDFPGSFFRIPLTPPHLDDTWSLA